MTIAEMKQRKKELGYTNRLISEKTGIPLSTVQKVFSGATTAPRQNTIKALESLLKHRYTYNFTEDIQAPSCLQETAAPYPSGPIHTLEDFLALPENQRAELVHGNLYLLAAPSRIHQKVSFQISRCIGNFIDANKGKCEVYPAPFDVYLFGDDSIIYEPDISVICNPDILTDKGCSGAPDWIIEIVSPSTSSSDYVKKTRHYQAAGVKEYWIVNPDEKNVVVYCFSNSSQFTIYAFSDPVPVSIYPGFSITISELV